jgi:SAM-dependent MidA family methyltransferase
VDSLTPAGEVLAAEIARAGPIPFSRFMDVALYHPEFGYYRRSKEAFGIAGDFYTAEQIQPVFGRLVATYLKMLNGDSQPLTVVELGAGRAEMRQAFADFRYIPVDVGYGALPERFRGIVFTNEFFDAVPVDVIVLRNGVLLERRITFDGTAFRWTDGPIAQNPAVADREEMEEGMVREVQAQRLGWLDRIDERLERGFIVTIDYGFTTRELIRFPNGTLMSYRGHRADNDVLAAPGEQDITAHVPFTMFDEYGAKLGWSTVSFEPLSGLLMSAGQGDEFAEALAGADDEERLTHRLQLKSLLFGMGETFRVLVQKK